MFTLEMIREAHSKVRTGADFPAYIQDMKKMGVLSYEHFVTDGHIVYQGPSGFQLVAPAKWIPVPIAPAAQKEVLQQNIKIHQQGKTDYPTFCRQAAEIGVEKWIVDLQKMMCTYYDLSGHSMVAESIPEAKAYSC
jgi:uncharacterized protein YbcV (DUF1398 family)